MSRYTPLLLAPIVSALALASPLIGQPLAADTTALQPSDAAAIKPAVLTVFILSNVPHIGYYDVEPDYSNHTIISGKRLARHQSHSMAPSVIPLEQRAQLQASLQEQETTAAKSAVQKNLNESCDIAALTPEESEQLAAALEPTVTEWSKLPVAAALEKIFTTAPRATRIILLRVHAVSHNTGVFIEHKALDHYVCVDVEVTGRSLFRDGRMLRLHTSRICNNSKFHSWHTEKLEETLLRQRNALKQAFSDLAHDIAADQRTR
ncbi:MAG: hypothetical protein JOZ57_03855 [Abitibacteriaceae bacterium]|nr:hypothetical protein [Abditibacteriaceae bacterium]